MALLAWLLIIICAGAIGGPASEFDLAINRSAGTLRAAYPDATIFVVIITEIGGAAVTLSLAALAAAILLVRARSGAALLLVATVLIERLVVEVLKDVVGRPRPSLEPLYHLPQSLAYPSGHSANCLTAFLAVALLAAPRRFRWASSVAALILAVMVGLSRIYLGVHWPTDVIGGWAVGLLSVGVAMWIGQRSAAVPVEAQHQVVGRHLAPPD